MLRKLSLAAVACMALSLVAFAPAASAVNDPQTICTDNGLTKGIYPPSNPVPSQKGKFDLTFDPSTAGAAAGVVYDTSGAILCGTDTDAGLFYTLGYIVFPGYVPGLPGSGERPVCARQNPTVALCDINGNGTVDPDENIANGSYAGKSQSDIWCTAPICNVIGNDYANTLTDTYVRYAASGNTKCGGASVVACFQSEATIGPVPCESEIVTYKMGGSYLMVINKPTCEGGMPIFFYTIDKFEICQYADEPPLQDPLECDLTGQEGQEVQFNGNAGTYAYYLIAKMNDGSQQTAIKIGTWTP